MDANVEECVASANEFAFVPSPAFAISLKSQAGLRHGCGLYCVNPNRGEITPAKNIAGIGSILNRRPLIYPVQLLDPLIRSAVSGKILGVEDEQAFVCRGVKIGGASARRVPFFVTF